MQWQMETQRLQCWPRYGDDGDDYYYSFRRLTCIYEEFTVKEYFQSEMTMEIRMRAV